ncbi:hypothetical protein K501DRAFT_330954 [Backusella circina FSU 941]|nr:hypothetical protein K501DRAFT_330954 [Backusella circina FSU 941]
MVSEKIFHVMNNEFTVYGLQEYEENKAPLRMIIAIHDIGKDRQSMRDTCLNLCKENVVVVTFDMINHGVRRLKHDETTLESFFKNPNFNLELWCYSQEATNCITVLLGAAQDHFFERGSYPVKEWCLLGQGFGAISCITSAIQEPRVSSVITIDASFEVLDWMELLVNQHHHDMETSLSANLKTVVHTYLKDKNEALQNTSMLMIHTAPSPLTSLNDAFLNRMFEIRQGTKCHCTTDTSSSQWKMVVLDQTGSDVDVINSWLC